MKAKEDRRTETEEAVALGQALCGIIEGRC